MAWQAWHGMAWHCRHHHRRPTLHKNVIADGALPTHNELRNNQSTCDVALESCHPPAVATRLGGCCRQLRLRQQCIEDGLGADVAQALWAKGGRAWKSIRKEAAW